MNTPVVQPDNSSSDSEEGRHKESPLPIDDESRQTFYLISLLAKHCCVRFIVTHPLQSTLAVPKILEIYINDETINFRKFIASLYETEPSLQQLLTTTNNYILDLLPTFGYSITISTCGGFDHIESVEKDQLLVASDVEVRSVGDALNNKFLNTKDTIELSPSTQCL
ncbi:hypothetical protein EIN_006210 [Entamoeba invadens IP1]|uniref:Uncharacterized protein n=1 Tax=Entamoeba invadens IP1 TaxID=370355 RepID=A0A0A1UGU1_ENTIV|nr:hypothetical protein EIN_006210 [Entamoeba invadens IP1]ELP93680.1 hypothetical protein EIN_006210 [Entamoeba invadens IP1]|eukprot:XP_004260451.1 hypothetical protein EIN_006210 [Entamoeba invadens IP1]